MKRDLSAAGFVCDTDYHAPYEEIKARIQDYHGIVIRSRIPIDRPLLEAGNKLEFVARSGSGLENIDTEAAKALGITVYSSPEGNRDAVAEHAIGMLLCLFNRLRKADLEVRAGIWEREANRGIELGGKTVGIIGFGNTGSALAKKLSGFDCRILAYDKYKSDYAPDYVKETDLKTIQAESDVISIHLPLSEETNAFVNADFIAACKKPFFLINTARGKHVVTGHLLDALVSQQVLGACLDVLEFEKSSFSLHNFNEMPHEFKGLAESDRVILSPHVAGWTRESYRKLSEFLAEKILTKHQS